MQDVIIIGAGVAGLAAALELAEKRVSVQILEARPRIGGRIFTLQPAGFVGVPIELGAEFVHGARKGLWPFIKKAKLETEEVPDRHWQLERGQWIENKQFWEELEEVTSKIDEDGPDLDFTSFLQSTRSFSAHAKRMAQLYVEGFHAAQADRISVLAIAKAESAAEKEEATRAFRIKQGYSQLVDWFADQLDKKGIVSLCNHSVKRVVWKEGNVRVHTRAPNGPQAFTAHQVLVTVPLGVLKEKQGRGHITFEPPLKEKQQAIASLEMGNVIKITAQFDSKLWPLENFGFIHAEKESFPTWWSHGNSPMLTGWAGGAQVERLSTKTEQAVCAEALTALSHLLNVERSRLKQSLVSFSFHDWAGDPFARGAYSYTPVGQLTAATQLSEPIANTVFFAGEATNSDGDQGTVHGAIATGQRAAKEILK